MTILIRCQASSPAHRLSSPAERKPSVIDTQPMVQTSSGYACFLQLGLHFRGVLMYFYISWPVTMEGRFTALGLIFSAYSYIDRHYPD